MTVFEEAEELVNGPRQNDYGSPSTNINAIAHMWNGYLHRSLAKPITAKDVCWMMALLKASRDAHRSKRDNLVDACGYLRLQEIMEED